MTRVGAALAVACVCAVTFAQPAPAHEEIRVRSLPAGHFRHEVVAQIPGTDAGILTGKMPAISLRVMRPVEELTLLGAGGEPFVRFRPGGVDVNEASPTWALTARGRGSFEPGGPVEADEAPRWRQERGLLMLTWLEPRAAPEREGRDYEWSVPARLDGRPQSLRGRSVWVPTRQAGATAGTSERPPTWTAWAPGFVGAVGGLGAFAGVAVRRRVRARRAGP